MNQTGDALATVQSWIFAIIGFLAIVFGVIEDALRNVMSQVGVPVDFQRLLIVVVAVLFIVAVLRLFGGFFRILLALFLILLILHILLPNLGF